MYVNQKLSCDDKQSYLAKLSYHKDELKKDNLVIFVNKKGQSEKNPLISKVLSQNPDLLKKLSKSTQTSVHGLPDSLFVRGIITQIESTDYQSILSAGANAVRQALKLQIQTLSVHFANTFSNVEIGIFLQGLQLRNYRWEWKSFKDADDKSSESSLFKPIQEIKVYSESLDPKDKEFTYLNSVVKHILKARDLGNTRADIATTDYMLEEAKRIQSLHKDLMDVNWISGKELEKQGYNLIYSVGKGSSMTPHLVTLHYKGNPSDPKNILSLVGKGVVFDTGGYALKIPCANQYDMFKDKCGAVIVLEVMAAIADLRLPLNVVGGVGLVENSISDHAYRNSDILVSKKGITVEINNTDAEGRLVLADVMTHVQDTFQPHTLLDFATLTSAMVIALGLKTAGVFGNDDELIEKFVKKGNELGEPLWHMPINKEHRKNIQSEFADIRQITGSTYGASCNAAAFLENFIEKGVKWVHTDHSAPSMWSEDSFVYNLGATGFGVRFVIDFIQNYQI